MSNSIIMVPVKGVKADLVTETEFTIYVPLASENNYGTVKIGEGLEIVNGVVSLSQEIIDDLVAGNLHSKALLPYDSTFNYKQYAVVFHNNDLYVSLQADNVGHRLTDTSYWNKVKLNDVQMLESEMTTLSNVINGLDGRITQAQTDATSALTKVGRIKVVDNRNGSFTFTNSENVDTIIQCSGANPDNETIVSNEDSELEAIGIKDSTGTITPSDVRSNTSAISTINSKIPAQASSSNQLADKEFVNSSISTNTATFRGGYDVVADLGLSRTASHTQIVLALNDEGMGADNNDYCFVYIPSTYYEEDDHSGSISVNDYVGFYVIYDNQYVYVTDENKEDLGIIPGTTKAYTPTIERVERYKYVVDTSSSTWSYEYTLNNSSFTASQWAAINSGATAQIIASIADKANDNAVVHLAGTETITGTKTFSATPVTKSIEFVNSIDNQQGNKLTILNDNGYNAKVKMGSTENIRIMSNGTYFGSTVAPINDDATDLGVSNTRWKDLYLSSSARVDNYIIDKDSFGQLQIRNANTTSLQIDGGTVRSQNIVPMANNQKDLGSSSMLWRDIYLGGVLNVIKSGVSGDAKWHIEEDQYGQLVVSRTYNDVKSGMIQFNGNSIKPVGANGNLGSASQQWKDLYLSGNLSDGTNSISVAQILTSGAFKSLNLTSTTLSADELSTIQNYNVVLQSDITLGSGTTLHAQTILTKPFSYSNTLRGLYIDNSKVGTYLIDTNTNTLGQGAQDIVLNGVAQINSKAIPSYPNDNNTYYLKYLNGNLTWVQDNTVKVNTTSYSTKRVYGQNAVGAEQMIQVSPNAYGQFLVERDSNGMFNVNEPTLSTHPASKNYVDTAIASAITTALNTPV